MDVNGVNVSIVTSLGAESSGADPGVSGLCSLCFLGAQPLGLALVTLGRGKQRLGCLERQCLARFPFP